METRPLGGDWLAVVLTGRTAPLPPDLGLYEARDTDPSDTQALRQLATLGAWHRVGPVDLPVRDGQWPDLWRRTANAFGGAGRWPADLEEQRHQLAADVDIAGIWQPVHLGEIALRLGALRLLAEHARRHSRGEPLAPVWQRPDARPYWQGPVGTDKQAWAPFVAWVNAALRDDFHPRVTVEVGDPLDGLGLQLPTVYGVGVLQLWNALTTGATYRDCANETCRRPFLRQRGRGRYYSRAAGVTYCSRTCANQQTQRDYRRRKRQETGKAGSDGG